MTTPTRVFGLLLATATFVAIGAASAIADEPNSAAWPDGESRSVLDTLIRFGGGTVGLFIVISIFGLLTARNNFKPEPGTELETSAHH
ncbi:hypothetical protein [Aeromicrobium sp.]|uniref:hypothetical protein n=1 Tax=Aeromicrobium sp. TaxID=1871063 RepID=UPI002FC5C3D5